jgi:MFS family permease
MTPGARRALLIALAAAAVTSSLAMGIRQTFGLLLLPLAAEHAIAPWAFGLAVALHNLVWGLAQPASGAMADKHGAGRVMLTGGAF